MQKYFLVKKHTKYSVSFWLKCVQNDSFSVDTKQSQKFGNILVYSSLQRVCHLTEEVKPCRYLMSSVVTW